MKPPDKAALGVPLYGELNHLYLFHVAFHHKSFGTRGCWKLLLASPKVFKEIMQLLHGFWHLEAR